MTRIARTLLFATVLAAAPLLGACNAEPAPDTTTDGAAAAELRAVLVDAEPAGALSVVEAKQNAKEGDEIVVIGRVGGAAEAFVGGRAVMTIADMDAVTACSDMPADSCPTPWDYCCEPLEKLVASTATVEVRGADSGVLRADLQKDAGIEALQVVVVRGVVGPRPDPAVLVIDATEIHVRP